MLKKLIADYIVKPFKAFPYFGRFRFWCLYWAYRITGWHIRNKEWDFILEYLPYLMKGQKVSVLDVGCCRNLLCHEIVHRGYILTGFDIEDFSGSYPGRFFKKYDITRVPSRDKDFVICISVLEHIELNQKRAIYNMIESLKIGGRLLLTIPTHEFAQGHTWHGFNCKEIEDMLPSNAVIFEYTERAGQLCLCIGRVS